MIEFNCDDRSDHTHFLTENVNDVISYIKSEWDEIGNIDPDDIVERECEYTVGTGDFTEFVNNVTDHLINIEGLPTDIVKSHFVFSPKGQNPTRGHLCMIRSLSL